MEASAGLPRTGGSNADGYCIVDIAISGAAGEVRGGPARMERLAVGSRSRIPPDRRRGYALTGQAARELTSALKRLRLVCSSCAAPDLSISPRKSDVLSSPVGLSGKNIRGSPLHCENPAKYSGALHKSRAHLFNTLEWRQLTRNRRLGPENEVVQTSQIT